VRRATRQSNGNLELPLPGDDRREYTSAVRRERGSEPRPDRVTNSERRVTLRPAPKGLVYLLYLTTQPHRTRAMELTEEKKETIIDQLAQVRDDGSVNTMDVSGVQNVASDLGLYALVE